MKSLKSFTRGRLTADWKTALLTLYQRLKLQLKALRISIMNRLILQLQAKQMNQTVNRKLNDA
jgi:hypothetical protein